MNIRMCRLWIIAGLCAMMAGCQQNRTAEPGTVEVTASIEADCVVQYYKSNQVAYLTRQVHAFDPAKRYFKMTAQEPTGSLECSLTSNDYHISNPKNAELSDLPQNFCTPMLMTGLFYSFCAGGGLIDTEMATSENVKLEGRWYQAMAAESVKELTVTLYKAMDTGRIERIMVQDQDGQNWLFAGHKERYSKELDAIVPRAVDVFDIQRGLAFKQMVAQFEYKDVRKFQSKHHLGPEESKND